jgi:hypothetical protein
LNLVFWCFGVLAMLLSRFGAAWILKEELADQHHFLMRNGSAAWKEVAGVDW